MSKLAKKPIQLPSGVKFSYENNIAKIEGPNGQLQTEIKMFQYVDISVEGNNIYVRRKQDTKEAKMYQGLYFALIKNMVKGVSEGYKKVLEVVGVGYQAQIQGKKLILKLGFSHPVEFEIPEGVKVTVDQKGQEITVSGIDKYLVGETAARIRRIKPPEPYKGTGIKYKGEHIIRKLGKAAIAAGGRK
ncbi:MAG: 50S ribosomal protein L6 [Endomicrobia bacterium]|nr:50S ribosomal protein L6 [Endomicrobiia bacterium]MDW8055491.1 50S ribosomal protein L6 [Elusimicrobiota bacterium]